MQSALTSRISSLDNSVLPRLQTNLRKILDGTIMEAIKEMFRDVLQQVMETELEETLGYEKSSRIPNNSETGMSKNYRNGYSKKTVKTQLGEVEVKIPRDRNGEYEPKIIGKYNRNAEGMEEKILALYACGMSQRVFGTIKTERSGT